LIEGRGKVCTHNIKKRKGLASLQKKESCFCEFIKGRRKELTNYDTFEKVVATSVVPCS
jgi:hypothetical protein